jgi:hypothetical protein
LSLVLRLGIGRRRRNQSIGLTSAGEPAGHLLDAAVPAAAQPGRSVSVFGRCGLPLPATSSLGLGSASPPRLNASAQATAKGVLTLGGADPKQYKGDIRSAKLSSRGTYGGSIPATSAPGLGSPVAELGRDRHTWRRMPLRRSKPLRRVRLADSLPMIGEYTSARRELHRGYVHAVPTAHVRLLQHCGQPAR